MKHPMIMNIKLLSWTVLFIIMGLLFAPQFAKSTGQLPVQGGKFVIGLLIGVLIGAVFWWFAMKKLTIKSIDNIYITMLSVVLSRVIIDVFGFRSLIGKGLSGIFMVVMLYVFVVVAFIHSYKSIIYTMRLSWKNTVEFAWESNLFVMTAIVGAAAIVANMMSPAWAIVLLFLVAIYDAVAVWKLGSMQKMAKFFMDRRLFPGIVVPYKHKKEKFALLGGGDVFFIVLVAASFWKTSTVMVWLSAASMFGAVIALFLASEKNKFYPALPFIFGGVCVAFIIGMFLV